jgi:signal transduction histidine kinase
MEQDQAVWQVIDRGIGIKEQELEHIFTPWWRGSNAGHTRGSGIGLSVVQGCVKAMGGVITVQSRENVGTTFTVIIPITGTGEE